MTLSISFVGAILLSLALGVLVGWERLHTRKYIGPRTYAFVSMAATFFTILSRGFYDTDRVAAAILTGIGFIGAGAILHRGSDIEGLTSAAGIWLMTAVGMAIGMGRYGEAIFVSLLMVGLFRWKEHEKDGGSFLPQKMVDSFKR